MPLGEFADFEDCRKKMRGKVDDVDAYCGKIYQAVEGGNDKQVDRGIYKRVETPTLQKLYKDSDKKYHLASYISSTLRDRDGDRFAKELLEGGWVPRINGGKINLGQDHGHSWKDTLGVLKHGEIRHNPHGDDITSAKYYLFADAVLEDPEVNKDVALLIHKSELGEQVSLSIAANPAEKNWYEMMAEKDGSNTRIIKDAELLKVDVVGEPANPDARMIGVFLKHVYHDNSNKCVDNCPRCFAEKDFEECIRKSMIPPMMQVEKASCKEEYGTIKDGKVRFELGSDQDKLLHARDLTHSHVCIQPDGSKQITRYGTKEKSAETDAIVSSLVTGNTSKDQMATLSKEEQDKLNKEHGCKEGEEYCTDEGKCVPMEEEKSKLSPEVEKFIESVKAQATSGQSLEAAVQQALAQSQINIAPAPTAVPANTGSANPVVVVEPVAPKPAEPTVQPTPEPVKPEPIPPTNVMASEEPKVTKKITKKAFPGFLMLDMATIEKMREKVKPKHEAPGEISAPLVDTTGLEGEVKKLAEEYNTEVRKAHATQVKQQYTANDLVKMSEEGKLLKDLDPQNNIDKTIKLIVKQPARKQISGTLLLKRGS